MGGKDKKGGKKGGGPQKQLSEEDMRRMGMPEEQIKELLAQRGMSAEDQAKQKVEEEAKKKATTLKAKFEKLFAELLHEESDRRRLMENDEARDREVSKEEEQKELEPIFTKWQIEVKRERLHREAQENREKKERAKADFMAELEKMSPEERARYDALTAEQQQKEQDDAEKRMEEIRTKQLEQEEREAKLAEKKKKDSEKDERLREFMKEMKEKGVDLTSSGEKNEDGMATDAADKLEARFHQNRQYQ